MREITVVITRMFLVLCSITFLCSLCWQKEHKDEEQNLQTIKSTAGFSVLVETDKGVIAYDPEEILIPMMRAMLTQEGEQKLEGFSKEYKQEFWKLLSVVCRTNIVKKWEESGRKQQLVLSQDFFKINTKEWNKEQEDENDIRSAITATKGIILCFQNQTIEAAFCYVTAGQTRNADEIYGDDRYPYLVSVMCEDDKDSAHYFAQYHFEKKDFFDKAKGLLFGNNKVMIQEKEVITLENLTYETESTGYVRRIGYEEEGIWIDATSFQEELGLKSPNFLVEEREKEIVVTTKGIGHGLGLSVYQALCMVNEEKKMEDILRYFYSGVTLEKKYV